VALENCGGEIQCVYYPFAGSGGDVKMLTSIIMHGRTQIVAMLAMGCPSLPFGWFLMPYDFAFWWSKSCFVVINHAVIVCCSGQLWMLSGCAK
jgi:hypothetical protein